MTVKQLACIGVIGISCVSVALVCMAVCAAPAEKTQAKRERQAVKVAARKARKARKAAEAAARQERKARAASEKQAKHRRETLTGLLLSALTVMTLLGVWWMRRHREKRQSP